MLELPLFPLDTVLFPGTPLHLHIFEERYKRMINHCINLEQPFGVVLIEHGIEAFGPLAQPFSIGTTAQIVQVQRLSNGRLEIQVVGVERFRIISIDPGLQPYLVGYVEPINFGDCNKNVIDISGQKLRHWVRKYLDALSVAGVGQFDIKQFPSDPIELAYVSAAMLQVNNQEKQALLSNNQADDLLNQVARAYRREVAILKALARAGIESQGKFSLN